MIKHVRSFLRSYHPIIEDTFDYVADQLLVRLEHYGMQPPEIHVQYEDGRIEQFTEWEQE